MSAPTDPRSGERRQQANAVMDRESAPLCEATAGYGDHVCCRPSGHDGQHTCRKYRRSDGLLWASWYDHQGDPESYACNHEEMEHAALQIEDENVLWRCTRCGVVLRQVDDPDGTITLSTREGGEWVNKRIRYEEVGS